MDIPIEKSDEWGAVFDSPFSLAAEDLCRVIFFTDWLLFGEMPSFEFVHDEIHKTEFGKHCPGPQAIKKVYDHCLQEIA